jgi:D-lactate dehydrogenase (cytochrome)
VLKLFPIPRVVTTALVAVAGLDEALTLLSCARSASGDQVSAFELLPRIALDFVCAHVPGTRDPLAKPHDHYVLIELSSGDPGPALAETMERLLGQAVEDGLVLDGVIAANTGQSRDLWKLRDSCSEAQKHEGGSIKHDVSVAVSRVPEFIRRATALVEAAIPGARPVPFGHVGDGNIHFNVSQPPGADKAEFLDQWDALNRIVHDLVHEMGGSFSAEHGVGQLKRDDLARYRPAIELALMRRIKTALDPRGIMNPGKVV